MKYEICYFNKYGIWTNDGIGDDNIFYTEEEAQEMIKNLLKDPNFQGYHYFVSEVV